MSARDRRQSSTIAPPGWPPGVLQQGAPDWEASAVAWLLDHCPADYRGYAAWRRHPIALAWITVRHIEAQLEGMRAAYRAARLELADHLPPEALAEVLADIEAEGVRLLAARRSAQLITEAMSGTRFAPRL
jgi:hypothetical protein